MLATMKTASMIPPARESQRLFAMPSDTVPRTEPHPLLRGLGTALMALLFVAVGAFVLALGALRISGFPGLPG